MLIENAQKYTPSEKQKEEIIREVKEDNEIFDPEYNALKIYRPKTANRYHSDMVGMYVHPTRQTANYAVMLLETEMPEYRERAFKVLEAVINKQDKDTASKTYGIWPYNFEEPLDEMNRPDWNWADFIGVQLLEAYIKYNDVIPKELQNKMKESIIHASRSIQERDVKPGYTNIAIMGTLVTHLTSHLFDLPDMKDYADMRMKRFYDYTKRLKGFAEYNSPTYTRVALNELIRMKQYILDKETLEMVNYCYNTGWKVMATHFHQPTGQLAGPHSRSYSTLIRDRLYNLLYGASNGKIKYDNAQKPDNYYKLQHKIPTAYMDYFIKTPKSRVQIDTFSLQDNPPIGYSYLTSEYAFGTVNRATTWQQRRPYLLYWGDTADTHFLRVQLLHDYVDFGIGNIFSVQQENEALTAMNFATNGGDYHISIDRISNGKFIAKDVRLRFVIANKPFKDLEVHGKNGFSVNDNNIQIKVNMLHNIFGNYPISVETGKNDNLAYVDYVIYSGEKKQFDLTRHNEACFVWHTGIQKTNNQKTTNKPKIISKDNIISAQNKSLSISIPVNPALEQELQRNFTMSRAGS
jgi:hypothetical protein